MSQDDPRGDVFELLLEEHRQLRSLLGDIGVMLAQRPGLIKDVLGKLKQLDEQVNVHFHAEEASDCFPELVTNSPRVSDRVTILLSEHGELRVEAHRLVQEAAGIQGTAADWERLAVTFEQFTAKLLAHEQAENELVQEVFTDDIGSKD